MKTRILPFCVLASTILTLTACQQSSDLHDMHDSTAEMRDTTKEMRDQMKDMNAKMGDMNSTTGKMGKSTTDMNGSMSAMLERMQEMNELMKKLILNTGDMNETTRTMNGSLVSMRMTMESMKKDTELLADKMDHLGKVTETNLVETNKRMKTMTGSMDSMNKTTTGLCQGSRNPQAADVRNKGFDALRRETNIETKVDDAVSIAFGMEWQMWGLCAADSISQREDMFKIGLEDFFAKLKDVTSGHDAARALAPSYVAPDADSLKDIDFDAIAFSIDRVHEKQTQTLSRLNSERAANQQIKIETIQSLLVEAYLANKAGKPLKPWQRIVIANNSAALRILQARHNFLIASVIGALKDDAVKGIGNNVALAFNKLFGGLLGKGWDASITGFQRAQLDELAVRLLHATQTRQMLISIGVKPVLDAELGQFVHNVTITDDKRGDALTQRSRVRFGSWMNRVKKDL